MLLLYKMVQVVLVERLETDGPAATAIRKLLRYFIITGLFACLSFSYILKIPKVFLLFSISDAALRSDG